MIGKVWYEHCANETVKSCYKYLAFKNWPISHAGVNQMMSVKKEWLEKISNCKSGHGTERPPK